MAGEYDIDFREHPERYRYERNERGVFKVEPYKSELLPLWQFRDAEKAGVSAEAIYARYEGYRRAEDFVGMDMARKYLQMGYTRAMRYARYPGGRKYGEDGQVRTPQEWADPEKRAAALVFERKWQQVEGDPEYQRLKSEHVARYEGA